MYVIFHIATEDFNENYSILYKHKWAFEMPGI